MTVAEFEFVPDPLGSLLVEHGLGPDGGPVPLAHAAAALAAVCEPWFETCGARYGGVELEHRMSPARTALLPDGQAVAAHAAAAAAALTAALGRDRHRVALFGQGQPAMMLRIELAARTTVQDAETGIAAGLPVALVVLRAPQWTSDHYWPAFTRSQRENMTTVAPGDQADAVIAAWQALAHGLPRWQR
jgi:hypothetical protein